MWRVQYTPCSAVAKNDIGLSTKTDYLCLNGHRGYSSLPAGLHHQGGRILPGLGWKQCFGAPTSARPDLQRCAGSELRSTAGAGSADHVRVPRLEGDPHQITAHNLVLMRLSAAKLRAPTGPASSQGNSLAVGEVETGRGFALSGPLPEPVEERTKEVPPRSFAGGIATSRPTERRPQSSASAKISCPRKCVYQFRAGHEEHRRDTKRKTQLSN